jgi:hypothetical protein
MNKEFQNQVLGMLLGLAEAWGKKQDEWTPDQTHRIRELYLLLETPFVVAIFNSGFTSTQEFLTEIGTGLYPDLQHNEYLR